MRGLVADLVNPHPLGLSLPAMYQDEDFAQRWVSAFDDILAPLLMTIDNFEAYLDPRLTPEDFLGWLAGWVGIELDENWSEDERRRLVATAAEVYQWRGTRRGIVELVHRYLDVPEDAVEVADSGGAAWSVTPAATPPGKSRPSLKVTVRLKDPASVDKTRLERLVAAAKPAHVAHDVEVVAS